MPELPAFANFDPVLCLATGLFRSLRRGTRAQPLHIVWTKSGQAPGERPGEVLEFTSDALLGADDLRVLQGVLAYANRQPSRIRSARGGDLGRLRARLKLEGQAADGDACLVQLGFSELARSVGYGGPSGQDIHGGGIAEKVRRSLDRLAGLTVTWADDGNVASWRLLSWDDEGARDRRLRVALNPRTGSRALGNPPYARIDLDVARKLDTDAARLIHLRLSAWIGRAKEARRIRMDTLTRYAWSLDDAGENCLRKRRWRVGKVVEELKKAGWRIEEIERDEEVLLVSGPSRESPIKQQGADAGDERAAEDKKAA